MATLEIPSNVKCITSGQVPTTANLKDGEFAFGKVGGVAKLYGNVNGVIIDFTGDSGTIDADTLNALLSGGNGIAIAKNTAGDKVEVRLSNNITLGPGIPIQGRTSSLTIKTFGGSKPVAIALNDNGISTQFASPNTFDTISMINIVEDGIKYVDSSEVTYNYLREGNVKTVNGQSIYGSGDIKSYPIGSIYLSTSSTSPSSLFGGTWEQIKGKFLFASDDVLTNGVITTAGTYHVGATGGSADAVVVEHKHTFATLVASDLGGAYSSPATANNYSEIRQSADTNTTGVSGVGKNMPPYLTVYMWRRLA